RLLRMRKSARDGPATEGETQMRWLTHVTSKAARPRPRWRADSREEGKPSIVRLDEPCLSGGRRDVAAPPTFLLCGYRPFHRASPRAGRGLGRRAGETAGRAGDLVAQLGAAPRKRGVHHGASARHRGGGATRARGVRVRFAGGLVDRRKGRAG